MVVKGLKSDRLVLTKTFNVRSSSKSTLYIFKSVEIHESKSILYILKLTEMH